MAAAPLSAAGSVTVERDAAVAIVRIDRPPLNLLNQDVRQELGSSFARLADDDTVRVVVFASGPANFCAGADMTEFPLRFDPLVADEHWRRAYRMTMNLLTLPKPVIAAIEGACFGGGLELALCGDRRLCAHDSKLGLPEIKRGVYPGAGGLLLLADLIGRHRAKQLTMVGSVLTAAEALRAGIVDETCEKGGVLASALCIAHQLADCSMPGLAAIKRLTDEPFLQRFAAHAEAERRAYVACYQTTDAREGNEAFFQKRAPSWKHR
jgi:enoyl-CoA hydratase/carnithine racemase